MKKRTMVVLVALGALGACGESSESNNGEDSGRGGTGGSGGGYYIACQSAKSCDEFGSDDDCMGMAGGELSGDRLAFANACVEKTTECFGDAQDICAAAFPMIRRPLMDAVAACLARPCDELEACFDAIVVPDCWD